MASPFLKKYIEVKTDGSPPAKRPRLECEQAVSRMPGDTSLVKAALLQGGRKS
jgi:hypothetical protein